MTRRMLLRKDAAAYCSLSIAGFEREINAGRLPFPVKLDNKDHWCVKELDKALDIITGAAPVPDYKARFYAQTKAA